MSTILSEQEIVAIEHAPLNIDTLQDLIYTLRFWREQAEIAREDRDQYKEKYEKILIEGVTAELEMFKQAIILGLGLK